MTQYKTGQEIFIEGSSGFCDPHWDVITGIKTKYDQNTGEPYLVIVCGKHEYRSDNGKCIKGAMAYFLSGLTR